ncbi:RNA-binding ATPase activator esf2 [Exophiala xenobiotica]|uniref:RNA-binding ATPase activator esf2 n=1 Tax=Lithohypha guttulata TaxID=1690604 RepID=A0ABR0JWA8_9EURO|nr:RNA-binding ATPase activator esf2 [Lithohypha guttulata]KAK5311404.1 RNA-binding ATPase activator esf2 [Exophiala xenobiotica]
MSAEIERVFSSTKKLLTPDHNALSTESLEVYELLRNWWRGDIILQRKGDGSPYDSDSEDDGEDDRGEGKAELNLQARRLRSDALALNAQQVGGKKSGFYYDDLWNMKYLKGVAWEELMAGIVEERREAEGKRDEERRTIAAKTQAYVEGVGQGKKLEGMRKKRKMKAQDCEDGADVQRVRRQHEITQDRRDKTKPTQSFDPEVEKVLSQII